MQGEGQSPALRWLQVSHGAHQTACSSKQHLCICSLSGIKLSCAPSSRRGVCFILFSFLEIRPSLTRFEFGFVMARMVCWHPAQLSAQQKGKTHQAEGPSMERDQRQHQYAEVRWPMPICSCLQSKPGAEPALCHPRQAARALETSEPSLGPFTTCCSDTVRSLVPQRRDLLSMLMHHQQ